MSRFLKLKRKIITTRELFKDIFLTKFMQLIAITSEIEIKKHPKSNHTPSSRTSRKDHRKRKRKTTSCMDVLFLVKEYFRIQRNLFNSL